jgi:hypothetical protein
LTFLKRVTYHSKQFMICQNCHAEVDNDLVFCTECGSRLHETFSGSKTVVMSDSIVTQNATVAPPKKSNLKWVALIVALLAIPISIFGLYLLFLNRSSNVTPNSNKPANTPNPSPTRKANTNQTGNANVNSNVNTGNTNLNTNRTNSNSPSNMTPTVGKSVWKERIEIAPGANYAVPFELTEDGTIEGTVAALQGSPIEGYVYTQEQFDQHFPDPIYKVFSIEGEKKAEVKQKLVKERYVLVFINRSESGVTLDGNLKLEK